jgi:hypothetical protein
MSHTDTVVKICCPYNLLELLQLYCPLLHSHSTLLQYQVRRHPMPEAKVKMSVEACMLI